MILVWKSAGRHEVINLKISCKMLGGKKNKVFVNVITGLAIMLSVVIAVRRSCYGIEITDEAFYVAEAVSILRGNAPITFTMSDKPFFPILLAGCIRIYQIFVPDLGGVFLFSRIMFIVFRLCISVIIYVLLRKEFDHNYLIFSLCFLFTIWGHSIPNLSYNTISCWLIILAGTVTFISLKAKESRKCFFLSGISGALISLAVLSHFGQALNAVWFGIVYLIFGETKKRWKNFLIYVCGGMGTLFMILFCFSLRYGWDKFIYGLKSTLFYINRIEGPGFLDNLVSVYNNIKWIFPVFGWGILIALAYKEICNKYEKHLYINIADAALMAVSLCMLIMLFYYYDPKTNLFKIGAVGAIFLLICEMIAVIDKDKESKQMIAVWMVFPTTYVVICGFWVATAAFYRFWMFDFVFWGGMLLFQKYYLNGDLMRKVLHILSFALIFFVVISSEWRYIYNEYPLQELNVKVTEGVYKGIFTTSSKAEDIQVLENYIRKVTSKEDRVLFLDNIPAAYVMSEGMPWTPSTWDLTAYSCGINNPAIYFRYFESREKIPTKIIYVDWGRNDRISADNVDHPFNEFVRENYSYVENKSIGKAYKVRVYGN